MNGATGQETENRLQTTPAAVVPPAAVVTPAAPVPEVQMDWKVVTQLLTQELTPEAFDKTLRYTAHVHIVKPVVILKVKPKENTQAQFWSQ